MVCTSQAFSPNPRQSSQVPVTKDMLIGEVAANYPEAVDIMLAHGFHCIGCQVSPYESIAQGAMGHGFTEEQVDSLVAEINEALQNKLPLDQRERSGIRLTLAAVEKIKSLMEKDGKSGMGLRIGVVGGGCAGYSYEMDFDQPKEDDEVFDNVGLKVFYHKSLNDQLAGIEIDYRETLQSSGFVMRNPNAKSTCGCGNSFG